MKSAKDVRAEFLSFFEEKGHRVVPSAPVVPHGDPTLLFTNAGMNQFKDVFLGTGARDYSRAVDTQKCIRVSGKHNDLEEVGVDTYHHTFFEMLGNWSFGDYFKKDAIAWAWELLVDRWGIDPNRLYVTVFGGDADDGLEPDTEAESLWPSVTAISPERVFRLGKKDNFWEMGASGPCGPCTEIHMDRGEGDIAAEDIDFDSDRFIELWNLVFIEYNRADTGVLTPLPKKHVDTGMGLERITAVLQDKISNYDTDLFTPIFRALEDVTGVKYGGETTPSDIAFRVIADHVRTLTVAFADGVLPGNEGRGYVMRRILRRAARFGRQNLDREQPFIHRLVGAVEEILGDAFPGIGPRRDHIELLIETEEKAFGQTLDRGLVLYGELSQKVKGAGDAVIAGEEAYDLYATFGFPRDLVELMAREDGLSVDSAGWDTAQTQHREASKGAGSDAGVGAADLEGLPATSTVYHRDDDGQEGGGTRATASVVKVIGDTCLVLDRTPCYAESGGQVGDAGEVVGDGFRFRIDDTRKIGDIVVHLGQLLEGDGGSAPASVTVTVDVGRRDAIIRNHTGTHLLHWALREVLGDHATQQGSLVAPDRLRFDVTHPKGITADEIERIEAMVNDKIVGNTSLTTTVEDLEAARKRGVTALFGEKYEDEVRVVDIGGYSTELCGGTHCEATGDIGSLVVVSESAVQAGVRRIEAVTGHRAFERVQEERRMLREVAAALKTRPEEVLTRLEALQMQVKELKKGSSQQAAADVGATALKLAEGAETIGSAKVVVAECEVGAKELAGLADKLRAEDGVCGVIITRVGGKVGIVAFASRDLAGKTIHAGKIVKEVAGLLGGGGGGRPDFAQAGGKDAAKVPDALALAKVRLTEALG